MGCICQVHLYFCFGFGVLCYGVFSPYNFAFLPSAFCIFGYQMCPTLKNYFSSLE